MFEFFKRARKERSGAENLGEFHRLILEVENQCSIGDTPYEQLVSSMGVIEKEMNHNGGCNWEERNYIDYLDTIRDRLRTEPQFTPE